VIAKWRAVGVRAPAVTAGGSCRAVGL
jgi:hypothetical protein